MDRSDRNYLIVANYEGFNPLVFIWPFENPLLNKKQFKIKCTQ
jgi:hypothetical protein